MSTDTEVIKERALFYLDRRINSLADEDIHPDHEQMAAKGVSYADRQKAEQVFDERKAKDANEREALQWARTKLMEA